MKKNYKCYCKICQKEIPDNLFKRHLINIHGFSQLDAFIEQEINTKSIFKNIPEDVVREYISRNGNIGRYKIHKNTFITFYTSITLYRKFDTTKDIDYFFSTFLPWKISHPNISNSKEQCYIIFHDNNEFAEKLYKETMLSKNPYYNHGGRFSPYSDKFVGYIGLPREEIEKRKIEARRDDIRLNPVTTNYWISKGYTEEEAKEKVHERQQTFSLKKCIEKYGEEDGYNRWKERQRKWLNTLNSKSEEEIKRINHDKVYKNGPSSGLEHEFLHSIIDDESYHNVYLKDLKATVDMLYENKIIEFYGDYWHCNPSNDRFTPDFCHPYLKMTAKEKWDFDEKRKERLENAGYKVLVIWESDYNRDKKTTIQKCKEFLGVK